MSSIKVRKQQGLYEHHAPLSSALTAAVQAEDLCRQHASSMIGQIDHEAHTNWSGGLHLVLTLPCKNEPIQQDLEGDAPAVLSITTTATWSISLLVPGG